MRSSPGLETCGERLRFVTVPGPNGSTILDDTYNASPVSCNAALDLLHELEGRHIAVFGDMYRARAGRRGGPSYRGAACRKHC